MPPIVLGLSGRKNSGKSTLTRFLQEWAHQLWPGLRFCVLPMAAELKRICVDLLGLPPEHVYGSDEDKEQYTEYRWEDLPHYPRILAGIEASFESEVDTSDMLFDEYVKTYEEFTGARLPRGRMKVRHVLQEVGTGIFRALHPDVHTRAWRRKVLKGEADVFVCDDFRFENEAETMKALGGFLVRLTGGIDGDGHVSETALRDDSTCFDAVLPGNGRANLATTMERLVRNLRDHGLVGAREANEVLQTIGEGAL